MTAAMDGFPSRLDGEWPLIFGLRPERHHDGGPLDFGPQREDRNSLRLFPEMLPDEWFVGGWVDRLEADPLTLAFGRCPLDTDGDGDCHACSHSPLGCRVRASQARSVDWSAGLDGEV